MSCGQREVVNCYHDGELSPADRARFESHLVDCEGCRHALAELQSLSRLIRSAERARAPAGACHRWRQLRGREERAVLRIAGWLTATAAAILLAALFTWPTGQTSPASGAWMTLAMTSADVRDAGDDGGNPDNAFAEWMANDLGDSETYSQ